MLFSLLIIYFVSDVLENVNYISQTNCRLLKFQCKIVVENNVFAH